MPSWKAKAYQMKSNSSRRNLDEKIRTLEGHIVQAYQCRTGWVGFPFILQQPYEVDVAILLLYT